MNIQVCNSASSVEQVCQQRAAVVAGLRSKQSGAYLIPHALSLYTQGQGLHGTKTCHTSTLWIKFYTLAVDVTCPEVPKHLHTSKKEWITFILDAHSFPFFHFYQCQQCHFINLNGIFQENKTIHNKLQTCEIDLLITLCFNGLQWERIHLFVIRVGWYWSECYRYCMTISLPWSVPMECML